MTSMPILKPNDDQHVQRVIRRIIGIRGTMRVGIDFRPRFDYGRAVHSARSADDALTFQAANLSLHLTSTVPFEVTDNDASAEVAVEAGEVHDFVLTVGDASQVSGETATALEELTVQYWRTWLKQSTYRGRWRETVERSALALKLLTHEPTGAIIAAPTTSLPETLGGERNWDYRFVWIRDAAFTLYALLRIGFQDEAAAFMNWLHERVDDTGDENGPFRPMYTIDGGDTSGEVTLEHWPGYRDSTPVRIRNDAAGQLQLDVYGELIDSLYLFDKYGEQISYHSWLKVSKLLDWLIENWQRPDDGLWESRGGKSEHTFSHLMSWVAFERMIRMARNHGLPADLDAWRYTRDTIIRHIHDECWSEELQAFTQSPGSELLDAALLLMPAVKFISAKDPRMLSTIEAINADLVTDTLVFRYSPEKADDGLNGDEGTFSMCSFWYVEALTRAGQLDQAVLALEKMFTYANPLGLYAEEIGLNGEQLGNFPQAFTHFSLISAAVNLNRSLD